MPLQPLYSFAEADRFLLVLRLPCGRALDLEVRTGAARAYGVWRLRGAPLGVVVAGVC